MSGKKTDQAGKASAGKSPATLVTQAGRDPSAHFGFVNPPIYRGSTVLFPSVEAIETLDQPYT